MANKNYGRAVVICLYLTALFLLCGCGKQEGAEGKEAAKEPVTQIVLTTGFDKDEVFRIGKSSCYRNEYMVYLTNIQNRYEAVYGEQIWSVSGNGTSMETRVKESAVARLAQVKAMNLLAQEYQVSLTEEEEKQVAQAAAEYYGSLNQTEIEAMGITEELVTQLYREYLTAHKVYVYIIRDINPEISDDEARNVTVDWIFLRSSEESEEIRALAEELLGRLEAGEDFDTLAMTYSDDKVITHTFGKGSMDSAVEECAFNLAEDETSGIVEGKDGYYIIHCVSTLDRKETDANKEKIITLRKKEAFNEVYDTFVKEQIKQFNEGLWQDINMIHDQNVTTESFFDVYDKYFSETE